MTEKDMIQIRSNITKNIINIQSGLLHRNYNFPDYENDQEHLEDLSQIVSQLETLFEHNPELVGRVLGGEIKSEDFQARVGIGVPLYLHLDVIIGIIEKGLNSTKDLEPIKKELISRLEKIRTKSTELSFDQSFDPKKQVSDLTIQSIIQSKGDFYYDKKVINGKRYLIVEATHQHESYDFRNGDVYVSSYDVSYANDIVFEEDKEEIFKKEQESKKIIMEEAKKTISKYFTGGKIPESIKDFKTSLIKEDMEESQLTFLFQLTEELLKYQINIKEVEKLLKYLKDIEPKFEEETPIQEKVSEVKSKPKSKKSIFERFKGKIGKKPARETTEEDIKEFEKARKEQIAEDEEVRDVVVFQRKIINGEEVLVPMSTEEFKVVRR